MECLHPKYITNRTLHYDLFQPLKLKVPCGKCENCKRNNRDDWYIRSVFEWKEHGCSNTYFYTLTYNNEHLPRFCGVPCFRKKDIQLFFKRLRGRLKSYNISCKYLVTCEYGELRNRSHYHMLLFLDRECNPFWLYKFIRDSWNNGFVMPGDNHGLVDSYSGIHYVTKYVTKDFSHLDVVLPKFAPAVFKRYYKLFNYCNFRFGHQPQVSIKMNTDFSFSRNVFGKCSDEDLQYVQKFLTKMRRIINEIIPFHVQSSCFGMSIKDVPTIDKNYIVHVDSHQSLLKYRVPRYYKRLLWYDCFENERDGKRTCFKLNDAGKRHMLRNIDVQIESEKHKLEYVTLNANVSKIDFSLIPYLQEKGYGFQNVRDLISWLDRLSLNLDVLSIYSVVFRGRYCLYGMDTPLSTAWVTSHYKEIVCDTLFGANHDLYK